MVRKTRKHTKQSVHTIPQLRRLFENIEYFVDTHIQKRESKEVLSRELRKEWKRIFIKEMDKESADAFIESRMKTKPVLRHTIKRGGSGPIAGAPLDYTTRQGMYLAPNSSPVQGQLPLANEMQGGGYGTYIDYINSGFWNPAMAESYDPIPGQQPWPTPMASSGSNEFISTKGGSKRKIKGGSKRKILGGNQLTAFATQFVTRPFVSDAPSSILPDMQRMYYGQTVGPSPQQVQRQVYESNARYNPPAFN